MTPSCLSLLSDFQRRGNTGQDELHYEKVGSGILMTCPECNGNMLLSEKLIDSFIHFGQLSLQNVMFFLIPKIIILMLDLPILKC